MASIPEYSETSIAGLLVQRKTVYNGQEFYVPARIQCIYIEPLSLVCGQRSTTDGHGMLIMPAIINLPYMSGHDKEKSL